MLIDPRWTRIPEEQIFAQLQLLPVMWRVRRIDTPLPRYYLFGSSYAYPYSLPLEVVQRLAQRLNENPFMFNWQEWIEKFITSPGYNDAESYGVAISNIEDALYEVIGVHHLTPDENRGLQHVFIDVLDRNNQRIIGANIQWTWEGRTQPGLPNPIRIDKPSGEIANLPFFSGVKINIWHPSGNGVTGLSANHPDELGPNGEKWNTIGHHSFLVVFRRISDISSPPKPPDPPPTEPPTTETVMLIKKSWLDEQEIDDDGFIRIKSQTNK